MKKLLILLSVVALAAFVVACGGDDDNASITPKVSATAVNTGPTVARPTSRTPARSRCTWATSRTSLTLSRWSG